MMKKSWTLINDSVATKLLLHESIRSSAVPQFRSSAVPQFRSSAVLQDNLISYNSDRQDGQFFRLFLNH